MIVLVAAWLRGWRLTAVPPGLWFDEALNGLDAWGVWQSGGGWQLVYPNIFPREPMFVTLLSLSVGWLGPSILALRIVPALIGTATVALLYGALRRRGGSALALTAAGVLATMRWHALMSRLVFRTILLPAWLIFFLWAAFAYRRRPTPFHAIVLGLALGGGFYTYLAWYFMLPWILGVVLWLGYGTQAFDRSASPIPFKRFLLMLAAGAVTVSPLAVHYLMHPELLLSRPGAVSVFAEGWAAGWREVGQNFVETLGMFHVHGDHVPIQNIPHRPALDVIQGFFFAAGVIVAAVRSLRRQPLALILLGWLICGVLPTIFTETDSPNFLRTLCAAPAVAALTALGLVEMLRWLGRRLKGGSGFRRLKPALGIGLITILLMISAHWTGYDLHRRWATRPDVWRAFLTDLRQLARVPGAAPPDTPVYVPAPRFQHLSFQYQTLRLENVLPYQDLSMIEARPVRPWADAPPPATLWVVVTDPQAFNLIREQAENAEIHEAGLEAPEGAPWGAVVVVPNK